ncbi:hypothetical protein [Paenibacillus kobensis]|uniref:hypothetical protein n=1 Tax=Paenibacillus kobensis TaxID=59841 RepID=UPI000FDC04FE|nr:hypothetical protein [Paenibacillus kobensis]
MEKCLLMGNGGREAIIAKKLSEKFEVYAIMAHKNPSIVESVEVSKGKYLIDEDFDKDNMINFIKENNLKFCIINSDSLLEKGLIDVARGLGMHTFGPTKEGARLEWDKAYALNLVNSIAPEMMIRSTIAINKEDLEKVKELYIDENFVVKPNGLTAGKGVKVGGTHFSSKDEGFHYAEQCLSQDGIVIIQDKINGKEFSITGFTDGNNLCISPVTRGYQYRYDNDQGPSTGGMGCITQSNGLLHFLSESDIEFCKNVMLKTIKQVNKTTSVYDGILYGSFFKCDDGVKFIEYNSRFGDPEALSVISVMNSDFANVVYDICMKNEINDSSCDFNKLSSYVVCVTSKGYAVDDQFVPIEFTLPDELLKNTVCDVYFYNSLQIGTNIYKSTGNSRLVGFVKTGSDLMEIKNDVDQLLSSYISKSNLDFRSDIALKY